MSDMSHALDLMQSDCLDILSAGRTVTIRTRVPGAFAPGTGKRTDTELDTASVPVIVGPDSQRWLGQTMRTVRVYQVAAAAPYVTLNLQSAMVIDGTEELDVIEYPLSADGRFLNLLCGKVK